MEAENKLRNAEGRIIEIQMQADETVKKSRNSDGVIQSLEARI
jgi:hypothetical protein